MGWDGSLVGEKRAKGRKSAHFRAVWRWIWRLGRGGEGRRQSAKGKTGLSALRRAGFGVLVPLCWCGIAAGPLCCGLACGQAVWVREVGGRRLGRAALLWVY